MAIAKHFNVPPMDLLDYPLPMFNEMVWFVEKEIADQKNRQIAANVKAKMQKMKGRV